MGSYASPLVGGAKGPGSSFPPRTLFIETNGTFWVKEGIGSRFTRYAADGELLGTVRGADAALSYQGFGIDLAWPNDGGYLGSPRVSAAVRTPVVW